ncbi:hypothetical protein DER46DRAFT_281037 [Fusarium sp. MPI-SDFR-AT-0072]|nr:hypothetical protein DER46DRAFT_281037 [Fusarium sp. MPI-SDFR-AT-0072]
MIFWMLNRKSHVVRVSRENFGPSLHKVETQTIYLSCFLQITILILLDVVGDSRGTLRNDVSSSLGPLICHCSSASGRKVCMWGYWGNLMTYRNS